MVTEECTSNTTKKCINLSVSREAGKALLQVLDWS